MHALSNEVGTPQGSLIYRVFDDLLLGYGWLGEPLFLVRGIGSATGLFFLEPFIYANVPAFLWLSYYGWRLATLARSGRVSG
jgi:hypothetical protein